ncbi:phage tail protein [Myxococcus xanthus]|uniref:Uncharacterized protein n=1 Tax=Myxococcus xanthus TaxID=34 RepID=A0A7Y4MRD4_MYXXA|nr:hypothetical protein [Myxococcus xanthus]NOJ79901.1 hypothetical protein [Myxococcus xanthus]NOJ86678.1 hypothetical protein [Myxococcus xanthus]
MSSASGGGLKVGDLYVIVTASIGQALKSMGQLAKATEEMAKQVKEAAEPVGNLGAVVAAGIGAAVAAAASSNYELRMELKHLTDLLYTLAADIGDLFGPTVKRLTAFVDKLVATYQRLSPTQKRAAADMAVWVAGAGLAIGTVGKLAGVVEGLAKSSGILIGVLGKLDKSVGLAGITAGVNKLSGSMRTALNGNKAAAVAAGAAAAKAGKEAATAATDAAAATKGVGKEAAKAGKEVAKASKEAGEAAKRAGKDAAEASGAIGPFLRSMVGLMVPLIALALALAGIALAAGAIYGFWKVAGDGIKESVSKILTSIGNFASTVWDTITTGVKAVTAGIEFIVRSSLSTLAWMINQGAKMMSPLVKALPKTLHMGRLNDALDDAMTLTGDDLVKGVSAEVAKTKAAAEATANVAKVAVTSMLTGAVEMGKDVGAAAADGLMDSFKNANELFGEKLGLNKLIETLSTLLPSFSLSSLLGGKAKVRMADDDERMIAAMGLDKVAAPVIEANEQLAASIKDLARHGGTGGRAYFKAVDDKARRLSAELVQAIEDARASIVSKVRAAFGRVNDLVNSFAEGFLAGGMNPLAGIGAVIMDLLAQSEGFQVLMEMVSTVIQHVADALGAVLVPLQPLVGAIFLVIDAVVGALTPVFETLGHVLDPLVPPLVLVGAIFETLAPILTAVAQAVLMVMTPLQLIAGPVLEALFKVLKGIAVVILTVAQGLAHVWNGIISAVQAVIRGISKAVEWLGIDSLKKFANSLDRVKVDTNAMGESLQALNDLTWETAEAKARETAEVLRNTEALQKATDALSNVPTAWKVMLRRYQSQDAQDGPSQEPTRQPPPTPSGGGARPPQPAGDGILRNRGGEELPDWKQPNDPRNRYSKTGASMADTPVIIVNNNIVGYDIDEALEEGARSVQRALSRLSQRFSYRST